MLYLALVDKASELTRLKKKVRIHGFNVGRFVDHVNRCYQRATRAKARE